ncbi:MAG TPA: GDSL-type esterase/lipase family protein [Sunxiuqinia sp.]|nr:GDSL-type esterase/lipase family protein [Sunxiuqinia sp.]
MSDSGFSRRRFIKSAGIAGAMTGLAASPVLAKQTQTVSNQDKGLRFLFQGDSITDGNRGRNADPNHILGHGYVFAIGSRVGADFPRAGFSFYNRGISGDKVPDLERRWQKDTLDLKPDVLSLLVGINDVGAIVNKNPEAQDLAQFESGYRNLLAQSKAQNPNILFVLGLPWVFPVGARKENFDLWKDKVLARAEVVKKLGEVFNAILVDFPAVFERAMKEAPIDYWIWDGIHPRVFGHELMAREWIKQVSSRLEFLNDYNY